MLVSTEKMKPFIAALRLQSKPRSRTPPNRLFQKNNSYKRELIDEMTHTSSLYIHWPFCKHICPYCNFNKYKSENVDNERMEKSLLKSLDRQIKEFGIKKISSIFFGGGTPSLCEPRTIENLINEVHGLCNVKSDLEVSLEANPSSNYLHKLISFKAAGINRVSIGVQVGSVALAFNDKDLRILGRDHTTQDAIEYIKKAAEIFDGKISIDLMFGRPGQTLESWYHELKMALALSNSHISLYQLTMERSTPMEKMHRRGEIMLPDTDLIGDMYNTAVEYLEEAGLARYEVANFSRKDHQSKHNTSYWRGQQYIGVGPGAHGRIHHIEEGIVRRRATIQTLVPDKWMEQVERNGNGMQKMDKLTILQTLEEILLQGMRTKIGVDQQVFDMFCGGSIKINDICHNTALKHLITDDFLEIDERGARPTPKGMGLLDTMMTDICLSMEALLQKQSCM